MGFASGDRFVVGWWDRSPVGPLIDVMWARPDNTRVLLAPTDAGAAFVSAVYRFDEIRVVPVAGTLRDRRLSLDAGPVRLEVVARRGLPMPVPRWRPAWFTRFVEGPIAARLLGVHTYGTSPTGVQEWYRADHWRPVRNAEAWIDGRSCGAWGPVWPPVGVGFSEPPRRPSMVSVRPLLGDPAGVLAAYSPPP